MKLPGLTCADCGASELLSVAPGDGELRLFNVLLHRPVLCQGWCSQCWAKRWGAATRQTGKRRRGEPGRTAGSEGGRYQLTGQEPEPL